MGTPYSTIIEKFIEKITEYNLLVLEDDEKDKIITNYMNTACTRFKRLCKQNLSLRDTIKQEFIEDLNEEVIDIITEGMIVEWLKPYINNSDLFKNKMNSKDYLFFSNSQQLREVRTTYESAKNEFKSLMNNYSYFYGNLDKLGGK